MRALRITLLGISITLTACGPSDEEIQEVLETSGPYDEEVQEIAETSGRSEFGTG